MSFNNFIQIFANFHQYQEQGVQGDIESTHPKIKFEYPQNIPYNPVGHITILLFAARPAGVNT